MNIRKTNPNKPVRILAYGETGVGKSTLGAKSEKPIFITPEGGADQLKDINGEPIQEMEDITTWDKLRAAVKALITEKHDFKTLVLDTADWIEGLAHAKIIGASGKDIIRCNGGYGSGYRESQVLHKALIDDLNVLREKRGMNIIITAHYHVKPVKDPDMLEDYDGYDMKCHEYVSSMWREWVDGFFFIRFRTFVKTSDDSKARALTDGTRVLYTQKRPSFQAKNRYGMPAEIEYTEAFWTELMKYTSKPVVVEPTETLEQVNEEIFHLWKMLPDEAMKLKVSTATETAGKDIVKLIPIRNRLREITGKKGE